MVSGSRRSRKAERSCSGLGQPIALASETARRYPGLGALIVSLPLVSVLSMIWLWRDTGNAERIAAHSIGTLWFLAPSIPMFFTIPAMLRAGWGFWPSLIAGCAVTIALYLLMVWLGPRFGLKLWRTAPDVRQALPHPADPSIMARIPLHPGARCL